MEPSMILSAVTAAPAWVFDLVVIAVEAETAVSQRSIVGDIAVALLNIYMIVLIVRVLLSWVPEPPEPLLPIVRGVHKLTDPVVEPLRRRLPPARIGAVALDFSVIIVLIAVRFVLIPIANFL